MKEIIGLFLGGMIFLAIGVVLFSVITGVLYEPYKQHAFTGEVQGLISEYCSAPKQSDKDAARLQLRTLLEGDPLRNQPLKYLTRQLNNDAQSVIANEGGVCN